MIAGTGAVGTVSISFAETAIPTGVAGTGAIGSATAVSTATPSGVAGTSAVGAVTLAYSGSITPTGVQGTGAVGTINKGGWEPVVDAQTPNWTEVDKAA